MSDGLLSVIFQQGKCPPRKEGLNCNNLIKDVILTSNVLIPSYINQLDRRDECQPALLPRPNDIIRPGSSSQHGASLCPKPEE